MLFFSFYLAAHVFRLLVRERERERERENDNLRKCSRAQNGWPDNTNCPSLSNLNDTFVVVVVHHLSTWTGIQVEREREREREHDDPIASIYSCMRANASDGATHHISMMTAITLLSLSLYTCPLIMRLYARPFVVSRD
jgi:hypothetical protein